MKAEAGEGGQKVGLSNEKLKLSGTMAAPNEKPIITKMIGYWFQRLRSGLLVIYHSRSAGVSYLLSAALAAITIWLFYPGFMSLDTLEQYREAIGNNLLNDHHPVIMVYLWRIILYLIPSPGSMLVFHQIVFWVACALFANSIFERTLYRLVCVVVLGLWAPLYIHSLILWKDTGMMATMMLCVAALAADVNRLNWKWIVLATISLLYGFAVRHNAFTAAILLLVAIAWRIMARFWEGKKLVYSTAAGALMLLIVYAGFTQAIKIGVPPGVGLPSILLWDMAAISIDENKNLIPDYVLQGDKQDILLKLKKTYNSDDNAATFDVIPIWKKIPMARLLLDWLSAIASDPIAYVKHRSHVFMTLLSLDRIYVYYPFHPRIDSNEFGFAFPGLIKDHTSAWLNTFTFLASTPIYRPWIYVLCSLLIVAALLGRLIRRGELDHGLTLVLLVTLSGLAMTVPLFVVATAGDYRYMLWQIASPLMAAMMLISRLERAQ